MKKLSIAIVLVAASVTFAKAQTTDQQTKVQTENAVENQVKVDTAIAPVEVENVSAEALKADEATVEIKTESAADMKQKARKEEKAAKKSSK